ncbi:hypothetical protein SAMN04487911_11240 [Arenibacter nanhaiticus]|uniref:YtkA-like n=1 Tax=Arenibacter nanhaiticus TaxID=558155 RepID=A0A1M6GXI4_9FLAO|nr:hypothetical protein [Arenibacter nanhaiticus]SHJ14666.1 hypothetical protein SAMN04487911_11240 [Arenibacter nanhaiticus]
MKTIKLILASIILSMGATSCSKEDDSPIIEENPMAQFNMVSQMEANGHTVELYADGEGFTTGYNEIYIRIKDNDRETYFANPKITWTPMMYMQAMMHTGPKSLLGATENNTVLKGYLVFQMAGNEDEYWDLTLNYKVEGTEYTVKKNIDVNHPTDGKQKVTTFTGSDNVKYVLAMVSPQKPKEGLNNMAAVLYKMESMKEFSLVENYTITLDPRMTSMGNHGSPNNKDLTYDATSQMYQGQLSLSMTGYWKLNLKVLNESGELLKGEDVTEENEASSLYFELEF